MNKILNGVILSLSPVSELRGSLIYFASIAFNPLKAYLISVFFNLLVAPFLFLFLSTLHLWLYRIKVYRKFFDFTLKKLNKKVEVYERRHKLMGYFALSLFTAIPFPVTGAYTATLIAWILGLNKIKAIAAISLGILTAGLIVLLIVYGFI